MAQAILFLSGYVNFWHGLFFFTLCNLLKLSKCMPVKGFGRMSI